MYNYETDATERRLTLRLTRSPIKPRQVRILGTGSYLYEPAISNIGVDRPAGVDGAWTQHKTGITSRRWAESSMATNDLASRVAEAALQETGLRTSEFSSLVVATSSPDHS